MQRIIALVPAHNEEASIGATIKALLAQTRQPDEIIIVADNCTDQTFERANAFRHHGNLRVVRSEGNTHKKSGAMNWAWLTFCQGADLMITLDADTELAPNAVKDWASEMDEDPKLGGSSSKFTMLGKGLL